MGIYKCGILGGFSGKVGSVIGTYWKGRRVMRSVAENYCDAQTLSQLTQRMGFGLASKFLVPLRDVIQQGYVQWRQTIGERNAAMRQILLEAVTGTYPTVSLDYGLIKLGQGSLSPGMNVTLVQNEGVVSVSWASELVTELSMADDQCLFVLYNTDSSEVCLPTVSVVRSDLNQQVTVPPSWVGASVECYLGFTRLQANLVSDCLNVGHLVIV